MGNMAGNLSSKVPPPLFSGNTPPLPGIAQIKSRHGPVAGTRAAAVWPWETSPGLPASGPNSHKYSIDAARQLIPSSIGEPTFGRGRVGKDKVWIASEACTSPASSSSPPFFFAPRVSCRVVSCGHVLPGQCSRQV